MNFNQIILIAIKVFTVILYGYTYYKFKRAQALDNTLKFKLKGRGFVEFYLFLILNILFVAMVSLDKDKAGFFVFIGAILFIFTYLNLERLVMVGRKVVFARFLAFDMRQIKRKTYERGKLTFYFPNGSVSVRFPVADIGLAMQMLSGSGKRR